jgi:hypothetical protein
MQDCWLTSNADASCRRVLSSLAELFWDWWVELLSELLCEAGFLLRWLR